jgi:hypothetical protein
VVRASALAPLPGLRLLQLEAEIALIPADFHGAQSPVANHAVSTPVSLI